MNSANYTTPSGYLLPSIHSLPPFFTHQPNPQSQSTVVGHWTTLILSYARHRRLFTLDVTDSEKRDIAWDEIFRNDRINQAMVAKGYAVYDPPKQTSSVLLYWNTPSQWANILYDWAISSGQTNIILTLYEISDPPVPSPLSSIPSVLLRRAITILAKSGKAQLIGAADGEGVKIFQR